MEVEIKDHRFTSVYNYIMTIVNDNNTDSIIFLEKNGFNPISMSYFNNDHHYVGKVNISQRSSTKINGGIHNVYDIQISKAIENNNKFYANYVRIVDIDLQNLSNMVRLQKIKAITNK